MKQTPKLTQALREKQQLRLDSMTGVNPNRTHGIGLWGNERVVFSVRVDKKLKKDFTEASKALFGSTCNPIECYMASIVGIHRNEQMTGVYPRLTVDIGTIKIERNLRERRKITKTVEYETETTETLKCCFADCDKDATAKGFYNDKEMPLCEVHFRKVVDSHSTAWRFY